MCSVVLNPAYKPFHNKNFKNQQILNNRMGLIYNKYVTLLQFSKKQKSIFSIFFNFFQFYSILFFVSVTSPYWKLSSNLWMLNIKIYIRKDHLNFYVSFKLSKRTEIGSICFEIINQPLHSVLFLISLYIK